MTAARWVDVASPDASYRARTANALAGDGGARPTLVLAGPPGAIADDPARAAWLLATGADVVVPEADLAALSPVARGAVAGTWRIEGSGTVLTLAGTELCVASAPPVRTWLPLQRRRADRAAGRFLRWARIAAVVTIAVAAVSPSNRYVEVPAQPVDVASILVDDVGPGDIAPAGLEVAVVEQGNPTWLTVPWYWLRSELGSVRMDADTDVFGPDFRRDYQPPEGTGLAGSVHAGYLAGARAAGHPSTFDSDGVRIMSAAPGSPFRSGDLVTAIDGVEVRTTTAADRIAAAAEPGDALEVTTGRGAVEVRVRPGVETFRSLVPGWVVAEGITSTELDVPEFRSLGIQGNSAGLAVALYAYQRERGVDLMRGRRVVATGAVEPEGAVLHVGGVGSKAYAAARQGADLMLVPTELYGEALLGVADARSTMRVVPVDTVVEAVDALRSREERP